MSRIPQLAFAVIVASATIAGTAFSQGVQTGTLAGQVTDQDRLALPGATVTVTSPTLQGSRSEVTDDTGHYTIRGLPPGPYTVRIELPGMTPVEQRIDVPLGQLVEVNAQLKLAGVAETVTVTAESVPSVLATTQVGANVPKDVVDALATPRTIQGIATLSPGVTENTPNAGQLQISGAFAYDNLFMVDGVDISDNLFGTANNLFIEDAIQETQVLTSGISAEFGRFSGGVVNAITRSGGNDFSGSLRLTLTNPAWIAETPFEKKQGTTRESSVNDVWEGTFGGPILRDRIWFFGAGRYASTSDNPVLPITGIRFSAPMTNKRGEVKVTGTVAPNQTVEGSYLNNSNEVTRTGLAISIDPNTIERPHFPNTRFVANWRGILGAKLFGEAQYSRKHFGFRDTGGTDTNIINSPFITLTQEAAHYNAPYFDATDPEDRDNRQVTGSLSYAADWKGRHDLKGGVEWYRSTNTGGNSQSATGFVFDADFAADAAGNPVFDAEGRLIPVFVPGETLIENWLPTRGASIDTDTWSFYVQDRWQPATRLTLDAGARYERVRSEATGDIVGVDTDTLVPRLGATFDVTGTGRYVVQGTYAHYAGKYSESQFASNTGVGNPSETIGLYTGPAGQGRSFAPGFNPANYDVFFGNFPTANVFFAPGLSSPITREWTLQAGTPLPNNGYFKAVYVNRDMRNFVEDFINLSTGATTVVRNGTDFGTFENRRFDNTNVPVRRYQALEFLSRYRITNAWDLQGNWTIQLKNEGNFEGENPNQPGVSSVIGDYPEITDPQRQYPVGRLRNFQRHRARLWTIYNAGLGRFGTLTSSLMWRYEGSQAYSLSATGVPVTAVQEAQLAALGYHGAPSSQTIFFGRGTERFNDYSLFDVSFNYQVPVFRDLRPWVKVDVFNIFNYDTPYRFNTAIRLDPDSPLDANGIPTGFIRGTSFGQPTAASDYPRPYGGETGGRAFLAAVGFRF